MRAAGFATQYFCFGNVTTTATFARDSVTRKVFHYGEIEITRLVADRAQKGLAGNLRFEIAAFSHNPDGRTRGPVGGPSAIKGGSGVRLANNRIGSSSQTGCDTDTKSSPRTCDGIAGVQRFQARACCGAERFSTTEPGGLCARILGSDSQCRNETRSQAHCGSETF